MQIPLLDLRKQYQSIKEDVDRAIQRVVDSQHFILGQEVERFEEEIADYCGVKHAIGVASGTDALLLSLRAAGIGNHDKVIVPPFTFFSTAGVVHNLGAEPIFVDIDPKTYNIDPDEIINRRTLKQVKAVIPVDLYGQMADMDEIMKIAREHNLIVIEDAAQAIGAEYRGRKAGTIGNLGCFSFFPSKNLGGYGDGGMVITNDDNLADKVRMLRVHGSRPTYYHHVVGYNSRLDALQAAILRAKLPYLDSWSEARRENADYYNEQLSGIEEIETPHVAGHRSHIYHQYTIRVKDGKRDTLSDLLKEKGIGTKRYYPLPLHLQECFRHLGYKEGDLPQAERASKEVLSLPVYPELTQAEKEYVVNNITDFFRNS